MKRWIPFFFIFTLPVVVTGCGFDAGREINYCAGQAQRTLSLLASPEQIPVSIPTGSSQWEWCTPGEWWTCGFWPGELWLLYGSTGDSHWLDEAVRVTEAMIPVAYMTADSHDVGFMITPSIGNGYRYTSDPRYRDALISAADSLATLFNPAAGTILSWPDMVEKMNWPHNTIIDNMLNLELLFWVGENCDRPDLTRMAARHAEVTMEHQFREDHSTYHVMVFDEDGDFLCGHTHQGWKDESTWARGQSWAVYGFTMAYRFTKDERFLKTAVDAADYFLKRLPEDYIPYWDFDAGDQLPDQPRDCSAAAVTASGLIELQSYLPVDEGSRYLDAAIRMLESMSKPPYRAGESCPAFLLHSTGHKPNGTEVDAAISYADYYYLEALLRLKNIH